MNESNQRERELVHEGLLDRGFSAETARALWRSIDSVLSHGPLAQTGHAGATGLALGYVQSGKTTAITALIAAASDAGYQVIVAILGSTRLLLSQNQSRLEAALGIGVRSDYRWALIANPSGRKGGREISSWLERERTVVVPVIKNATRLGALASALTDASERQPGLSVLIVDDEADQASLNTRARAGAESSTYAAIGKLREAVPNHLYVQFTATPYAPLLLEEDDHLRPDFVEMLQPGPGYTGGREFFVDHAERVVRYLPALDEQRRTPPTTLPRSLVLAFANFVAGAAILRVQDPSSPPISMLVHSTHANAVQERYRFLLDRLITAWRDQALGAEASSALPAEVLAERLSLHNNGVALIADQSFLESVRYVLRECVLWLVNSATDVNKVDWTASPIHVLVGGNKLDRGFTVEGLTVTYMNRPASEQIDTLEQRARAFGYRGDLLPFCQFFASARTVKVLREIVDSEYDLRARLRDWLDEGRSVGDWAHEVGLLLPEGTRPTRQSILTELARFNERPTWHQMRRPSLEPSTRDSNERLLADAGLLSASYFDYGRLSHRTVWLPLKDVLADILVPWVGVQEGQSPGWRREELLDFLSRLPKQSALVPLMLLERPEGGPRLREWDVELGFINLMQGPDLGQPSTRSWYPGDRNIGGVDVDPEQVVVQVHSVQPRNMGTDSRTLALAVHAGRKQVIRKVRRGN